MDGTKVITFDDNIFNDMTIFILFYLSKIQGPRVH